jgi:predicted ATPase
MGNAPEAPFIHAVRLHGGFHGHAVALPALRDVERIALEPSVTFFVGENGSGKSTLVEAIAVAAKFNAEGELRVAGHFTTRASHSNLHEAIELEWAPIKPVNGYFLRAESFYNVATASEGDRMADVYERPLHEQSHGESFIDAVMNGFAPRGLYLLDEPEAALSVRGTLALMRRMHDLVKQHSQFIVATHSPILVAFPGATIYALGDDGIEKRAYDETDQVELTRAFIESPERFLRHLLADD